MESWHLWYMADFNALVATNPNYAPFPASNLFNSLEGMYVSKVVWDQKTTAPLLDTKEGLHEDQQPWTYFDAISTFDTSTLKLCSSTSLEDTTMMGNYVRITGDEAGVDSDGVGVCHASHWWLAPGECRTSSGVHCVPWITAGNGYNLLASMQKATMWQIPMAIGVASSWTAFTELPPAKKCLFYWWEPDSLFAELEPKYVTFPAHDAKAWSDDDRTTAPLNSMLENLVSYDLPDLAPDVYGFIHNFEMSMDTMRGIMRDVASGTTVEEAACGWTKQNEDVLRGFLGQANTTERTTVTFSTTQTNPGGRYPPELTDTTITSTSTLTIVTCLENGLTVRTDLVNANGESYPLGIEMGNWASSEVFAEMVRVVISEVLGYNAQKTGHSGTYAVLRALFGCTNPADSSDDTGCSDGDTRSHVMMESWHFSYQAFFDSLAAANPNIAPVTASNLFNSLEGIYISKAVWEQKTTTPLLDTKEGLHVDQQPWNYFDDISTFDSTKLMPCGSTQLANTDVMQNYVAITGDTEGVDSAGVGHCYANHWWLAPGVCRTTPEVHCVPWITGGTGWHLGQSMQKATMWQIPMAIGVAADWGSFGQIPMTNKCLFYWWEPDLQFIALEPKYVTFPAHDATAWSNGDYSSAPANPMLANLVSYDLPNLAPDVYGFIHNFEMSMDTIRGIVGDLASGTTAEEAACEWIKSNEDVWRGWIPTTTETMTTTVTATETMTSTVTTTASMTVSTSVTTTRTWTLQAEPTIPDEVDVTEPEGEVFQATLTSALQALQSEEEKVVIESATGTVTVVKLQVTEDQTAPVVFEFGDAEGEPSGMVVSLPPALIQQLQSQGDVMLTVSEIDQTVQEQLTAASDSETTSTLVVNAPVIEISLVKVSQGEVGKADVSSTLAPIVFKLQDADPGPNDVCVYFDEDTKQWSANGLTLLSNEQLAELFPGQSGGTWCEASHLTIFSAAEQLPTTTEGDENNTSGASRFTLLHAASTLLASAMLWLAMR
eukprot:s245_g17.t1